MVVATNAGKAQKLLERNAIVIESAFPN